MANRTEQLLASVKQAIADRQALAITGNGSKTFIGRAAVGTTLSVGEHTGIVEYEPSEMVVTARAGTTIADLDRELAGHGQMLASEPPRFAGKATLAGTLACNLSGPARPWAGSLRDHVLGLRLINGRGEHLRFGGQVMKNVAGYDVARLQAGAMGVLGVITEVSVRVQPVPECRLTRVFELDAQTAMDRITELCGRNTPLSGACWHDGRLYLRLAGPEAALGRITSKMGGENLDNGDEFWQSLRDFEHRFFAGAESLFRFSLPPATGHFEPDGNWLLDWGGAQRWLSGRHELAKLETLATESNGQVSLFKGGDRNGDVFHQRDAVQQRIHQSLKAAFDPLGIFNPGRLYRWM